ncbi:unnamed protein product [Rhizophagus irregularis]|nr:unnamed protein product [Rhizophagus irregularis]
MHGVYQKVFKYFYHKITVIINMICLQYWNFKITSGTLSRQQQELEMISLEFIRVAVIHYNSLCSEVLVM